MSSGMHPYPEALYYSISADFSGAALIERDEFKRKQFGAVAMVFAALCLEAFINQEYDRLRFPLEKFTSLRQKWLDLPRRLGLVTSFNEKSEPFGTFDDLIALRNDRLVHFKPAPETRLEGASYDETYFGDLVGDAALATKYFECCAAMIRELNFITQGNTDLPGFLTGHRYMSRVWASHSVPWESVGPRKPVDPNASPEGAA